MFDNRHTPKPYIGISANMREGTSCIAFAYYQAITAAGAIPLLIPITNDKEVLRETIEGLHGLVLSGGGDIDPAYFGEQPIPQMGEINPLRDQYDMTLIELALQYQLPLLAICRGHQLLNVALGGTLYQDIYSQMQSPLNHSQNESRETTTHTINLSPTSRLATLLGSKTIAANTFHHQAIKDVAPNFEAVAWSSDKVIEAIESPLYPSISSVQWHPENLTMANIAPHKHLFDKLVQDATFYQQARSIHATYPIIDSHCDTPMVASPEYHLLRWNTEAKVDLPKMRAGGLDAAFMVAYLPQSTLDDAGFTTAYQTAIDTIKRVREWVKKSEGSVILATTPQALHKAKDEGKRAIVPAIENGYALAHKISNIAYFKKLGISYITLCHNGDNDICDSARKSNQTHGGLSLFGKEVVAEMNRLGIMIDVSHAADSTIAQVTACSSYPIIASHSASRAICNHPRNISDALAQGIAAKGGVIQICLYNDFIANHPQATVEDAVDHIDHLVALLGIDHVGIGSDFDGGGELVGCSGDHQMINITLTLLHRGYTPLQIAKIWGGNLLRVWETVSQ